MLLSQTSSHAEFRREFLSFRSEFRRHFSSLRSLELEFARRAFGHAADNPEYHPHETIAQVHACLSHGTMEKLNTFGYALDRGKRRFRYWVDPTAGIPDMHLAEDGSVSMESLPKELVNHVYYHHVHMRRTLIAAKTKRTKAKNNRPKLLKRRAY